MDGKEEEVGTARVTTRGITGGTECIIFDVDVWCVSNYRYVYCDIFLMLVVWYTHVYVIELLWMGFFLGGGGVM